MQAVAATLKGLPAARDRVAQIAVHIGQSLLEPCDVRRDVPTDGAARKAAPILFGRDHLDQLAPARHQAFQQLRGFVGQWSRSGAHALRNLGEDRRIERVGFREPALARAATAGLSNPLVASSTTSVGARAKSRGANSASPGSSLVTDQDSSSGSEAMSRVAFETSTPMKCSICPPA